MGQREHLEAEIKLCLSEPDYLRLHDYLMQQSIFLGIFNQRNVYLETANFDLTRKKEMVRLRETDGFWTATHKFGIKVAEGQFESQEWENDFGRYSDSVEALIAELLKIPRFSDLNSLMVQGELINIRHKFQWQALILEIDQSFFSKKRIDYELECETQDFGGTSNKIRALFDQLKIAWSPQTSSKYRRFLDYHGFQQVAETP